MATLKLLRETVNGLLADAIDHTSGGNHDGILEGAYMGLFTDWDGFDPDMVLADIEQANYGGYARQAVTYTDPFTSQDGKQAIMTEGLIFNPNNANEDDQIIGAFLADSLSGGNMLAIGLLDEQTELAGPENQLQVVAKIELDANGSFGSVSSVE